MSMSLRGRAVEERRELPDGRVAVVWIGVPGDEYVEPNELDTVALELHVDGELTAALNTVLDADDDSEARQLALEVLDRLESGDLEPSAGAIEPLADQLR
jgi:hypothetical protein